MQHHNGLNAEESENPHYCIKVHIKKICQWEFPGSPLVKNLPCNAGDADSILGLGTKIPHAEEQLGPCATTNP